MVRDTPHCPHCGGLTLQIVVCDECGEPFLEAAGDRAQMRIARWREDRAFDDFAAEAETDERDEEGDGTSAPDARILLARPGFGGEAILALDRTSGLIADVIRDGHVTLGRHEPDDGCPYCGAGNAAHRRLFRPLRLGAPFLVGNSSSVLLDAAPEAPNPDRSPHGGRQMLTFTDNRQGTARLAAMWQQDAERNYARAVLLHA